VSGELTALGPIAPDGEEMLVPANGGDWWMAWYRRQARRPDGRPWANAFCLAGDGTVVVISADGELGVASGRPEPGESWE
jgi:hypothetical protein